MSHLFVFVRVITHVFIQVNKLDLLPTCLFVFCRVSLLLRVYQRFADISLKCLRGSMKPWYMEENMALIKCSKCGKNIPDSYQICPFCKNSFLTEDLKQKALDILLKDIVFNHSEKNKKLILEKADSFANRIVFSNFDKEIISDSKIKFDEYVMTIPLLLVEDPKLFIIKKNPVIYKRNEKYEKEETGYWNPDSARKFYNRYRHKFLKGNVLLGLTCKTDEETTVIIPEGVTHLSGTYYFSTYKDREGDPDCRWSLSNYCFLYALKKVVIPSTLQYIPDSTFSEKVEEPIVCDHPISCQDEYNYFRRKIKLNFINETIALHSEIACCNEEYIDSIPIKEYFASKDLFLDKNTPMTNRVVSFLNCCKSVHIESQIKIDGDFKKLKLDCPVYYSKEMDYYKIIGNTTYIGYYKKIDDSLILNRDYTFIFPSVDKFLSYLMQNDFNNIERVIIDNKILTELTIPSSLKQYKISLKDLVSVYFENGCESIPESAFAGCDKLSEVHIPNTITSIGSRAFSHCESLESINIPNSVTSIGDGAFSHCESLESINIPNSVTSIKSNMFNSCHNIKSISIPNSVTQINTSAFDDCSNLEELVFPNTITKVFTESHHFINFVNLSRLKQLTIPFALELFPELIGCDELTLIETYNLISKKKMRDFENNHFTEYKLYLGKKIKSIFMLCPTDDALEQVEFLEKYDIFKNVNDVCIYFNDGTSKMIKSKNKKNKNKKY